MCPKEKFIMSLVHERADPMSPDSLAILVAKGREATCAGFRQAPLMSMVRSLVTSPRFQTSSTSCVRAVVRSTAEPLGTTLHWSAPAACAPESCKQATRAGRRSSPLLRYENGEISLYALGKARPRRPSFERTKTVASC